MRKQLITICALFIGFVFYGQSGHVMQGVGAVNMSMGGAATAQPLDINGAMQWNPAAISAFDDKIVSFSLGAFFSSPELSSSVPAGLFGPGSPAVSGTTKDDRPASPMPALAYVWSKPDSKHTFGVSAFGISGFGVTFPQETNLPVDLATGNPNPNFDPNNSNVINYPQALNGFGKIESDYMLLQVGFTYAYELSDKVSIGIQPNINYAALELEPNPVASPSQTLGYPVADKASAIGFGGQIGIFYDSHKMLKLGLSYKTKQVFSDFDFDQKYLDGSTAPNVKFKMNYPSILSFGLGLSGKKLDFAADVRFVNYENAEGFAEKGWVIAESGPATGFPTGAVKGFGWKNMTIFSVGLQYKATEKMPIRIGYTNNSSPIQDELTFFSSPATAVINNAVQFGLGYKFNDKFELNAVYHMGLRGDGAKGTLLSPRPDVDLDGDGNPEGPWNATTNPLGIIPGTSVSYDMQTSMIQFTLNYTLGSGSAKKAN
jgi:long-chain fatty acid transport protein